MRHDWARWALGAALAAGTAVAAAHPPATALCKPGETIYFACTATTGTRLALCGRMPLRLQLRVQAQGQPLLALPADATQGPQAWRYAHYFRPQVDYVEVAMTRGDARYTLYERRDGTERGSGLEGDAQAPWGAEPLACRGPRISRLPRLKPHLACDTDNALTQGRCG